MLRVSSSLQTRNMSLTGAARCGLLVVLLACNQREQTRQASDRSDSTDQARLVVPVTDSSVVVASAISALQNTVKSVPPLRVSRFVRQPDGTLVTMMAADQRVLGGGGVVWVPREGAAIVLLRYE